MTPISSMPRRVWTRIRRDGLYAASRYYRFASKHALHYLIYDRRWDRLDTRRTSGALTVHQDDIVGVARRVEELRYQAMARLPLIWALRSLDVDYSKFAFIDYGSGRGRLLLTAARFPFRKIVGVEFSRTLHQEACLNIASYPDRNLACGDIASLNTNAVDYDLPDGDCVAFFFNPFTGEVLDDVASRIEACCRAAPRTVYVIFANSDRVPLFTSKPSFRRFKPRGFPAALLRALAPARFEFFVVEPTSSSGLPRDEREGAYRQ